jgi:DNA mismatch repair protein MSH4
MIMITDLDKMLAGLSKVPKKVNQRVCRAGVDTLIMLKHSVGVARGLGRQMREDAARGDINEASTDSGSTVDGTGTGTQAMGGSSSSLPSQQQPPQQQQQPNRQRQGQRQPYQQLHDAIVTILEAPALAAIAEEVGALLSDSTAYSKSSLEMRYQECFAVRAGVSGLLDVARSTYLQSVEEIYQEAAEYARVMGVAVKVAQSANRGFYLQVHAEQGQLRTVLQEDGSEIQEPFFLPLEFRQAVQNKRCISCTTEQVRGWMGCTH